MNKNKALSYPVVLEKNVDGRWTVSCPLLPGCISEGDTKKEAVENIKDAIHLYLRSVKKELTLLKHRGKHVLQIVANASLTPCFRRGHRACVKTCWLYGV